MEAIWTVTILSALSAVVILVLLGRRVFRREAASLDGPEDPCRTYGNGPRQLHRAARERKKERKRKEKATPLHRAGAEDHAEDQEEEGHAEALALADPNAWDLDDASVVELGAELCWAAQKGQVETAAKLVDAGADPNAELHSAARRNDTKAVTTLLYAGADSTAQDP